MPVLIISLAPTRGILHITLQFSELTYSIDFTYLDALRCCRGAPVTPRCSGRRRSAHGARSNLLVRRGRVNRLASRLILLPVCLPGLRRTCRAAGASHALIADRVNVQSAAQPQACFTEQTSSNL